MDQKAKESITSPFSDDVTDPGQSEVFDDSLSEPRRGGLRDARTPKQKQVYSKLRRGSPESFTGGSLTRSPRVKSEPQKDESPSKMTQTHRRRSSKERPHAKESSMRSKTRHRADPPEDSPGSRASQEIEVTEEYPELAEGYQQHRKTRKESPVSLEKRDSPQRYHSGKHKREKSIAMMSDVYNGAPKLGKKHESRKRQKNEEKEKPDETQEMQTIPVIKVSWSILAARLRHVNER